jgi:hypothetical protein
MEEILAPMVQPDLISEKVRREKILLLRRGSGTARFFLHLTVSLPR